MNAAERPLVAALLAGDRRAIARAISTIENGAAGCAAIAAAIGPRLGRAHVVGITGPPGAGKSTLINALLGELIRRGRSVAVVAVDPSSPISGGAVLGDRVRMGEHGVHEKVFIRSIASRGHLGGVSRTTRQIVDVLDAAGFDVVIVETVGAGQSEIAIVGIADTRIVVCPPGLGDEVQAIKAGILEIADLLVVSKADQAAARDTMRELKDMLRLRAKGHRDVPMLATCATHAEGVAALADAIEAHACNGCGRRLVARPAAPRAAQIDLASAEPLAQLASDDRFANALGIRFLGGGAGSARVTMTVGEQHLNFNGSCHGGAIFALADAAFGLASNSHGHVAAGIDAHITYQAAAAIGDSLIASAVEISRSRRLAVYRVDVARDDGALLSSFTGTVHISTRQHSRNKG
jgi:LAO/AO transport system ATPase/phenylacetic acid degradation protein PaaD